MDDVSILLEKIKLPKCLHLIARKKLYEQIFDAGNYFEFIDSENYKNSPTDIDNFKVASCTFKLRAIQDVSANSEVFLADHMWTTTHPEIKTGLANVEFRARLCQ